MLSLPHPLATFLPCALEDTHPDRIDEIVALERKVITLCDKIILRGPKWEFRNEIIKM